MDADTNRLFKELAEKLHFAELMLYEGVRIGNNIMKTDLGRIIDDLYPVFTLDQSATEEQITASKKLICEKQAELINKAADGKRIDGHIYKTTAEIQAGMFLMKIVYQLQRVHHKLECIEDNINQQKIKVHQIDGLREYTYKRALNSDSYANSFLKFGCVFFNFSRQEKLSAANHLIELIKGNNTTPLTNHEKRILRNGELGKQIARLDIDLNQDFAEHNNAPNNIGLTA